MNTAITDLFPVNNTIHNTPFKDLINNSIGYFLELIENEVTSMNEGCFINTAEGRYLDLWGKDLGIRRLNDESDDDYRTRLMISPLEQFTINTVYELYDLQLMTKPSSSSNLDLTLMSDNHFLNKQYYVDCADEVWNELDKKFLTTGVLWRYP